MFIAILFVFATSLRIMMSPRLMMMQYHDVIIKLYEYTINSDVVIAFNAFKQLLLLMLISGHCYLMTSFDGFVIIVVHVTFIVSHVINTRD